ncbi:MAG: gamma carbonic anhydrase family protein [Acidobacteriota bacterium]
MVAPTAVIQGDVSIGPGSVVLHYAVLTAESAPVRLGAECVVMEHAVIRGAGKHPAQIADRVLIGPHAHITGATIGEHCMIATQGVVFNGASLGPGSLVAIGGIVHVGTVLEPGSRVPMKYVAAGNPAQILPPSETPKAHSIVNDMGFTLQVFDQDTSHLNQRQSMEWISATYSRALRHHGFGSALENEEPNSHEAEGAE